MNGQTKKYKELIYYKIIPSVLGGVYLGYLLTLTVNRAGLYILLMTIPTALFLIAVKFKWNVVKIIMLALMAFITLAFLFPAYSASTSIVLENRSNIDLNVYVLYLNMPDTKNFLIPSEKSLSIILSYESFKDDVFLILATDYLGNICHQERIKVADIKRGHKVTLCDNYTVLHHR
jgi:hypothetical protein